MWPRKFEWFWTTVSQLNRHLITLQNCYLLRPNLFHLCAAFDKSLAVIFGTNTPSLLVIGGNCSEKKFDGGFCYCYRFSNNPRQAQCKFWWRIIYVEALLVSHGRELYNQITIRFGVIRNTKTKFLLCGWSRIIAVLSSRLGSLVSNEGNFVLVLKELFFWDLSGQHKSDISGIFVHNWHRGALKSFSRKLRYLDGELNSNYWPSLVFKFVAHFTLLEII